MKTLYKEFMEAGQYINDTYNNPEVPIHDQLQQLLTDLPEEEQLDLIEADILTLQTTIQSMKFESPSMDKNVNDIKDNVVVMRDKLRSVNNKIQQLMGDLNFKRENPKMKPVNNQEWKGKSRGRDPDDFDRESLIKGAKVEMEHTEDKKIAVRIAMDHLTEDPLYYDKLEKIHKD